MILTALKTLTGQISVVLLAATAAWGWLKIHDRKVVQGERARVENVGKKIDAKAQVARKRAIAEPDRMLSKYCRDC